MDNQPQPSQLNILDLPEDIVYEIFAYFGGTTGPSESWYRNLISHDDKDLETVQALRLVCRAFCQLASPLLVTALRVGISSESLNRADQLTKNPLISAGIRHVLVSLAYRSREMAEDASRYSDAQVDILDHLHRHCDLRHLPEDLGLINAKGTYARMKCAWRDLLWRGRVANDSEAVYFRSLRLQWHEEYRQRYQDQERLLHDGLFSTALASSISRIPPESLRVLCFVDNPDHEIAIFPDRDTLHILANDVKKLRRAMISAHKWRFLEKLDPKIEIPSTKLLWQLPIAIHATGNYRLRGLSITPLPTRSNLDKLCPNRDDDWGTLKTAFQSLETINVISGSYINNTENLSSKNQCYLKKYFSALVSSPYLEDICFDLRGLDLHSSGPETEGRSTDETYNPISSSIAKAHFQNAKRFTIGNVALSEEELVGLLSGLGSRLHSTYLHGICVLKGGGWTHALDVLREKIRRSPDGSSATLWSLWGGEFDVLYDPKNWHSQDGLPAFHPVYVSQIYAPVYMDAERYVNGVEDVNPMAKIE